MMYRVVHKITGTPTFCNVLDARLESHDQGVCCSSQSVKQDGGTQGNAVKPPSNNQQ